MPTPRVTDERLLEVLEARRASKSAKGAGAKLVPPISGSTVEKHLMTAALRGLGGFKPVIRGFEIASVSTAQDKTGEITKTYVRQRPERGEDFVPPRGMALKGITADIGPDGKINRSWPRYAPEPVAADVVKEIKEGLLDLRGRSSFIPSPTGLNDDLKACYFVADAHLGQLSWGKEVGVNHDLEIAEEQICKAVDESLYRAPLADLALIAILGDYCHADDVSNATPMSKHALDVDGRHGKTRRVASRCLRYQVERTREKHRHVILRYIPGNHDPMSAGWLSHALWLCYEGDFRVTVDDDQGPFGFYEHGLVMNGLFHGDKVRPSAFKDLACSRMSEMWGRTKFRFGHCGHRHKREKLLDEAGGMVIETHQATTAPDSYAFANFSQTGRSIDTAIYDKNKGKYCEYAVGIE